MARPIITLTTDFGSRDGYGGIMKGVILGICPEARLVDLSHEVPPQDVLSGALVLQQAVPFFPTGSIHVAVIDPGVGTERNALALSTPEAFFVGPDNGLFDLVWSEALERWGAERLFAVRLTNPRFFLPEVNPTFHGRDVFAPVAAHLARGAALPEMGLALPAIASLGLAAPLRQDDGWWIGEILAADRFGNCLTSFTLRALGQIGAFEGLRVWVGDMDLGPIRRTYSEVARGQPVALIGSSRRLELAVREGHFAQAFQVGRGARVRVGRPG